MEVEEKMALTKQVTHLHIYPSWEEDKYIMVAELGSLRFCSIDPGNTSESRFGIKETAVFQ